MRDMEVPNMKRACAVFFTGMLLIMGYTILPEEIPLVEGNETTTRGSKYWGMDMDLSLVDASFWGEDKEDYSGNSISVAGDVNGDGYDDILIGAYRNDDGGERAGQTYLIFGKSTGWSMDTDLSNADASFLGENVDDWSGGKVAGAGDVNNDGYDDILIGATGNDDGGERAGQTYLIFGKSSGWSMDMALSNADASFIAEEEYYQSGASFTSAGDVNGDGYDDILIGVVDDWAGGQDAGQTYLIFGKSSGWSMDTPLSKSNASFIGEDPHDWSGRGLSGGGDVNDDGYDDILIGARGDDDNGIQSGQTYLIFGKDEGWSMDTDLSEADASFIGENAGGYSGNSISSEGDVNGDGYADILIGALYDEESAYNAGQTYLILGKAKGWSMRTDLSNANASFLGEAREDHSGCSVSIAGDINGDGYDDILIGASGSDDGGTSAGQTYLIFGKPEGWSKDTDLAKSDASFIGEDVEDVSGITTSLGGDVNNDGYADILIGALYDDDGGSEAGQTYLVCGMASIDIFRRDYTPQTATTGDEFIFSIEINNKVSTSSVDVEYWYGTGDPEKVSMKKVDFYTWSKSIVIPADTIDNLNYNFTALVSPNYLRNSTVKSVSIIDNDEPEIKEDLTAESAYTGDPFTFSADIMDNIGVESVKVEYWYGNGSHQLIDAVKDGSYRWENDITIPSGSLDPLHYKYSALDSSGNSMESEIRDIPVYDNDRPELIVNNNPTEVNTGEEITLSVNVTDNIGVSTVCVDCWYGEGSAQNVSLERGDNVEWHIDMSVDDTIEPLQYIFRACDTSDNWNQEK